jgi:hypothetical protein
MTEDRFGIHYEQDDAGKDTGRFQVVDEVDDFVLDTFDTEKEAEDYMAEREEEFAIHKDMEREYLAFEEGYLARHKVDREELRVYLVNMVLV